MLKRKCTWFLASNWDICSSQRPLQAPFAIVCFLCQFSVYQDLWNKHSLSTSPTFFLTFHRTILAKDLTLDCYFLLFSWLFRKKWAHQTRSVFSDVIFCCLSCQVFARRQINLLTAQAWLSESKQLEDKVTRHDCLIWLYAFSAEIFPIPINEETMLYFLMYLNEHKNFPET